MSTPTRAREPLPPGDPLGTHRVVDPPGALPQAAWRLDADFGRRFGTEIVIDVGTLAIDAASFRQMLDAAGGDPDEVGRSVLSTVAERGKQHNPVTGSGGMLVGTVEWIGERAPDRGVRPGDRVATLASLTLTPLALRRVRGVRAASAQMDVEGTAVAFASAPIAAMPDDLPERLALSLFDVAGAAPQVARLCGPGDAVVVIGAGGKSGLLCCAQARRRVGAAGRVVGVEASEDGAADLRALGPCDAVIVADARDPVRVRDAVLAATGGREADLAVSCASVPGVEMSAILVARARGRVYFFSMATSFTAAALGAEGIGRDVDLYIGNGYAEGHAAATIELVRTEPALRATLERRAR